MEQKLEALQAAEQQAKNIEARLADKDVLVQVQKKQLDVSTAKAEALANQVRDLELALATADAKLAAQQGVVAELRAYLDARGRAVEDNAK